MVPVTTVLASTALNQRRVVFIATGHTINGRSEEKTSSERKSDVVKQLHLRHALGTNPALQLQPGLIPGAHLRPRREDHAPNDRVRLPTPT